VNSPGQPTATSAELPSCTVLVCTRQRPEELRQCLDSVRRLNYARLSILVVENDAVPGEAEEIARSYGASYRLCTRRGLSAARNLGAKYCSSDLLAFIDDDAICDPDWILNAAPLFRDQNVYVVTGKVIFHSDAACTSLPTHEFDPGNHLIDRTTDDWFGMTVFGGLGLGGNFIIRRSSASEIGPFDERLGRGTHLHASEENLFLFDVIDRGYRVATCSGSVVRHPAPGRDDLAPTRSIAVSTAIVALFAVEHPRHLPKLGRYLWGAVRRTPQPWRQRPRHLFEGMASSRGLVPLALLSGPFLYVFAAVRHLVEGTPCFDTEPARTVDEIAAERAVPKMRA
jgi:cellulose synthase/poly-beta-1,6-N-acetylglucosamine synthase-like glycosyltransferase